MKPEDSRAQKSEPHETAASTGRRDDDQVSNDDDATEASNDRPRDTADENAGGRTGPHSRTEESAADPDNSNALPEVEDLPREAVVTKADHLEDQIQQLRSTVAILKSLAGIERPVDEVGELFTTETCNTDDDWEYLLALLGEAARKEFDDPYERAAYVVDHWCHELHHEPQHPYGDGPAGFATDGGEDVKSRWTCECQDCDWTWSVQGTEHPAEGPPTELEKKVRVHKNTTDESHIVRAKGTHVIDDRDVDPSLVTDGGEIVDAASDSGVDPRDTTEVDAPDDYVRVDLDIDAPHVAFEHQDTGLQLLARNPVNVWYIEIWTPDDSAPDFRTGSRLRKTSAISLLETKLETSDDGTFMGYPEPDAADTEGDA